MGYEKDRERVFIMSEDSIKIQSIKNYIDVSEGNGNSELSNNLFNCIQDGISILDLDFNIVDVNTSMKHWYSYRTNIVGEKCYKVFHNRIAPCSNCPTLKVIRTGKATTDIVPYMAPADKANGWQELAVFPVFDGTKKLSGFIECVKDITVQRKLSSEILKFREQIQALDAKNRVLNACLQQKGNDKKQIEENISYNVKNLIMPCIRKLKRSLNESSDVDSVLLIENLLSEIISPFAKDISTKYLDLTSREIQIISLIKDGKTSKEISEILFVSAKTVDFHRANIRKKLGIRNGKKDKTSLRAYLLTFL